MSHLIDVTGQRFGRLTVLRKASAPKRPNYTEWVCLCDCGNECSVWTISLRKGQTRSCGCLRREISRAAITARSTTHGMTHTPEFTAWTRMKARCSDSSLREWPNYGGRGIRVCDEWQHDFVAFFKHIGPKPSPKHSVDRIDNNGNYEPGNVRWATSSEQAKNRRRPRKAAEVTQAT